MSRFLEYAKSEAGVVTLTMSRPEDRNALSDAGQFDEFVEVCGEINRDATAKVVILTGAGSAFCSGGNIKQLRELAEGAARPAMELRGHYRFGIQRVTEAMWGVEVPTIAAVNGPAIGAGCDLSCTCDVRIASERAVFAESFVKLGIISGDGGAWLLPRVVGMSKACEMAFTGDRVDADSAAAMGLVSKVVPEGALIEEAAALAGRMAENSGPALRMTKKLIREGMRTELGTLLEMSAAYQAMAHSTAEYGESMERFFAKRRGR